MNCVHAAMDETKWMRPACTPAACAGIPAAGLQIQPIFSMPMSRLRTSSPTMGSVCRATSMLPCLSRSCSRRVDSAVSSISSSGCVCDRRRMNGVNQVWTMDSTTPRRTRPRKVPLPRRAWRMAWSVSSMRWA
ncbi:Uncharacterised protein [Bordetella pertussis]|nr:Uncharacterised protein [Bordetella pertussis]